MMLHADITAVEVPDAAISYPRRRDDETMDEFVARTITFVQQWNANFSKAEKDNSYHTKCHNACHTEVERLRTRLRDNAKANKRGGKNRRRANSAAREADGMFPCQRVDKPALLTAAQNSGDCCGQCATAAAADSTAEPADERQAAATVDTCEPADSAADAEATATATTETVAAVVLPDSITTTTITTDETVVADKSPEQLPAYSETPSYERSLEEVDKEYNAAHGDEQPVDSTPYSFCADDMVQQDQQQPTPAAQEEIAGAETVEPAAQSDATVNDMAETAIAGDASPAECIEMAAPATDSYGEAPVDAADASREISDDAPIAADSDAVPVEQSASTNNEVPVAEDALVAVESHPMDEETAFAEPVNTTAAEPEALAADDIETKGVSIVNDMEGATSEVVKSTEEQRETADAVLAEIPAAAEQMSEMIAEKSADAPDNSIEEARVEESSAEDIKPTEEQREIADAVMAEIPAAAEQMSEMIAEKSADAPSDEHREMLQDVLAEIPKASDDSVEEAKVEESATEDIKPTEEQREITEAMSAEIPAEAEQMAEKMAEKSADAPSDAHREVLQDVLAEIPKSTEAVEEAAVEETASADVKSVEEQSGIMQAEFPAAAEMTPEEIVEKSADTSADSASAEIPNASAEDRAEEAAAEVTNSEYVKPTEEQREIAEAVMAEIPAAAEHMSDKIAEKSADAPSDEHREMLQNVLAEIPMSNEAVEEAKVEDSAAEDIKPTEEQREISDAVMAEIPAAAEQMSEKMAEKSADAPSDEHREMLQDMLAEMPKDSTDKYVSGEESVPAGDDQNVEVAEMTAVEETPAFDRNIIPEEPAAASDDSRVNNEIQNEVTESANASEVAPATTETEVKREEIVKEKQPKSFVPSWLKPFASIFSAKEQSETTASEPEATTRSLGFDEVEKTSPNADDQMAHLGSNDSVAIGSDGILSEQVESPSCDSLTASEPEQPLGTKENMQDAVISSNDAQLNKVELTVAAVEQEQPMPAEKSVTVEQLREIEENPYLPQSVKDVARKLFEQNQAAKSRKSSITPANEVDGSDGAASEDAEVAALQQENADLKDQIVEKDREISDLQEKGAAMEDFCKELEQENADLSKKNHELLGENAHLNEVVKAMEECLAQAPQSMVTSEKQTAANSIIDMEALDLIGRLKRIWRELMVLYIDEKDVPDLTPITELNFILDQIDASVKILSNHVSTHVHKADMPMDAAEHLSKLMAEAEGLKREIASKNQA